MYKLVSLMEFRPLLKLSPKTAEFRNLSFSPALKLKQIIEEKKGNEIIIRGEHIPSSREPYLVKNEHPSKCPVCSTGLELKHTDVLILSHEDEAHEARKQLTHSVAAGDKFYWVGSKNFGPL